MPKGDRTLIKRYNFDDKKLDEQIREICGKLVISSLTKTADYDVHTVDRILLLDGSSNTVTIKIPLSKNNRGKKFILVAKDISNTVKIDCEGSDTIGGSADYTYTAANEAILIAADGVSDWTILSTNNHTGLVNIGTNTHAQIDSHIGNTHIHKISEGLLSANFTTAANSEETKIITFNETYATAPRIALGVIHNPIDAYDPVAWYKFQETSGTNLSDSSTHSLDGTARNTEDGDWTSLWLSGGIELGGTNEDISLPTAVGNFDTGDSFSIEFVIQCTAIGSTMDIYSRLDGSSPFKGWRVVINDSGNLQIEMIHDIYTQYLAIRTDANYADGSVHHVVITYDGSGHTSGVSFYIDGSIDTSTTSIIDTLVDSITNTSTPTIGSFDGTDEWFIGKIADMVFYDFELNSTQVSERYNSGSGSEDMFDDPAITYSRKIFPFVTNVTTSNATIGINNIDEDYSANCALYAVITE
jgi:hypothetical protein